MVGEGARTPKAQWHPNQVLTVDAPDTWRESHVPYPGSAAGLLVELGTLEEGDRLSLRNEPGARECTYLEASEPMCPANRESKLGVSRGAPMGRQKSAEVIVRHRRMAKD